MQDLILADSRGVSQQKLVEKALAQTTSSSPAPPAAPALLLSCVLQLVVRELGGPETPLVESWIAQEQQQQLLQQNSCSSLMTTDLLVSLFCAPDGAPRIFPRLPPPTAKLFTWVSSQLQPLARGDRTVKCFLQLCQNSGVAGSCSSSRIFTREAAEAEEELLLLLLVSAAASDSVVPTKALLRLLFFEIMSDTTTPAVVNMHVLRKNCPLRLSVGDLAGQRATRAWAEALAADALEQRTSLLEVALGKADKDCGAGAVLLTVALMESIDRGNRKDIEDDDDDEHTNISEDILAVFAKVGASNATVSLPSFMRNLGLPVVVVVMQKLLQGEATSVEMERSVLSGVAKEIAQQQESSVSFIRAVAAVFVQAMMTEEDETETHTPSSASCVKRILYSFVAAIAQQIERSPENMVGEFLLKAMIGNSHLLQQLAEFLDVLCDLFKATESARNDDHAVGRKDMLGKLIPAAAAVCVAPTLENKALVYGAVLKVVIVEQQHQTEGLLLQLVRVICSHLIQSSSSSSSDAAEDEQQQEPPSADRVSAAICTLVTEGCLEPLLAAPGNEKTAVKIINSILLPHAKLLLPHGSACSVGDVLELLLAVASTKAEDTIALRKLISLQMEDGTVEQHHHEHQQQQQQQQQQQNSSPTGVRSSIAAWLAPTAFSAQLQREAELRQKQKQEANGGGALSALNRLALLALQRAESTDRDSMAKDAFGAKLYLEPANAFFCSAQLQTHLEFGRCLLAELALQIVPAAMAQELWFRHCVEEQTLLRTSILRASESSAREQAAVQERGLRDVILFPLATGVRHLLLAEAGERAPLGQTAASYSSASWLFEEERVVRSQVLEEEEGEARAAELAPALERLQFCVSAEAALRRWAQEFVLEIQHPLCSHEVTRSVFATVLAPESSERGRIGVQHAVQSDVQLGRESIEAQHEERFFFVQRLKRLQERYINDGRRQRLAAWATCCAGVFSAWVEEVVEPEWELGIDAIYQQREEEGAEVASVERRRQQQRKIVHPTTVKQSAAKTVEVQQQQQQQHAKVESAAATALPETTSATQKMTRKQLGAHVAASLTESELTVRQEMHAAEIDAFERIGFLWWRATRVKRRFAQ